MKVPESQRIKVLDLRISLNRQGENILDRIWRRIRLSLQRASLGIVKTVPLFVILYLQQLPAVLFYDGQRVGFLGLEKVSRIVRSVAVSSPSGGRRSQC